MSRRRTRRGSAFEGDDTPLRALFEHSRDGIYLHDLEGRFLDANPAALEMLGYAAEEILSLDFGSLLTTEQDLARVRAATEALVASGRREQVDLYRLRRKDGETIWVEVLGTLLREGDRPTAVLGVARDVTERKRAEEELRHAEKLRERAFSSMSDAVLVIDSSTRTILSCNPATERMFGYPSEELVGQGTEKLHADRESYLAFGAAGEPELEAHGVFRTDYRMKRRDGTVFEVELVVTAIRDDLGWAHGVVSVVRDITERRRAEAELRLQGAALDSAADAIVITDRDGAIQWVNRAFTSLSGYEAAEALGRDPRDLVRSGVHPESFYAALWDTILSGEVWRGEITNRRKDGSLYPEALTITPVSGERGETTHFVAIKRDLTELKQLEARYLQAQKMESVGRLAGGVAHDFNNLLTVIIGRADLALQGLRDDDPRRPGIEQIHDAGQRAARLTRQLLAFSRKQILQPAVIDLRRIALDWRGALDRLIGETIELVISAPEDVGRVSADPGQIEQVIMNLVVNARDAMPEGGRLTIEVRDESIPDPAPSQSPPVPPGRYVTLAVSDTGTGIDEKTREQIFEPFFTTKGPGKGTGLGLATVDGIVQQSGGHIQVESQPGSGTTFRIYLPVVEVGTEGPEHPPASAEATKAPGTKTVLVVEDEEALRELAESVLESAGYTVLTAPNGREALRRLREHQGPVDLVFTDVVLPGMSGRQLAERIAESHPRIRVLFTSGYTDDAGLRDGVHDSRAHFLAKPYTVAELQAMVREVLDAPR